jgi:hypothetical protein
MNELHLTIGEEEGALLRDLLERMLKESRIEEHRTRTPLYREGIIHREEIIVGLLNKLGMPADANQPVESVPR